MIIELKRPFASNGEVDGGDVLRLKRALNRLGYYVPDKKIGITPIPDRAVFSGLEAFQKDHGLAASGAAKPGDETVERLNAAIEKRGEQGRYIWQTVGDDKVRESHADLEGQERSWRDFPRPGGA